MVTAQILHNPAPTGSFEAVDGLDMFIRRSDPNTDEVSLVLVHGLGGMSTNWTDLMHLQAARGRASLAMDLPGFGRTSADPQGDYSLDRHARAVIALLESLAGPVNLVGNSLGGAVVTTVAAQRPDLVTTLTLLAPALPHISPSWEKLPIVLGILPRAAHLLSRTIGTQTPEERVDGTLTLTFGDTNRIPPHRREEAINEHHIRAGMPHIWDAFVSSSRGLGKGFIPWRQEYLWRKLDDVQAPVLAIFGTKDRLVDPKIAGRVARTISGGTVVVLPGVGHVPQMELPITVDRLLDAHILGQL